MSEAILVAKSLKHKFVKNYVLKYSNTISEENAENKRTYVINSKAGRFKFRPALPFLFFFKGFSYLDNFFSVKLTVNCNG